MDDLDFKNPAVPNLDQPIPLGEGLDKPIPIDDLDKPIPLDIPPAAKPGVSHAPLDLGGPPAAAPAPKAPVPRQVVGKPAAKVVSGDRITGIKTFFTKLHPGALNFLDEQITNWLKENPGISIKHTNLAVGEVQSKKTEPNIIISVWY